MMLSLGIIYADILMVKHALQDYKANPKIKDIKNMAAYHLQQAVEKLIKYQIYRNAHQVSNRELYTHNIGVLIEYAKKENLRIRVPQYVERNCEIITKWEAGSRYDLHFSVRIDTLEKSLSIVEQWYSEVKSDK